MKISQGFDGGNIEVVSDESATDLQLRIRQDANSQFYQWFYFRLSGASGVDCVLRIMNADGVAYPGGFQDYQVLYSYDRQEWRRHPTRLNGAVLEIPFTPEHDSVYFAYFVPYSMERHHDLVARSQLAAHCQHRLLGQTLDGQDLDLLTLSTGDGARPKNACWIIARQHPGETMAQWWMEGCLEKLLDLDDPLTRSLLERADLYLVPNMNPDGSRRGHLRTNAAGRNLNREWADSSMEFSPEVHLVKQAMAETGVDFLLDVHGDESLPYCFIAGTEGLSDWDARWQQRLDFYKNTLAGINPDFQIEQGYPAKQPGQANLTMSTAQTAHRHGCLALTLEMPFKDTTATPDATYGWSAARSKRLAHSCLETLDRYLASDVF